MYYYPVAWALLLQLMISPGEKYSEHQTFLGPSYRFVVHKDCKVAFQKAMAMLVVLDIEHSVYDSGDVWLLTMPIYARVPPMTTFEEMTKPFVEEGAVHAKFSKEQQHELELLRRLQPINQES